MQYIQPETFAKVMRLPDALRRDLLEFIGGCEVEDREVRRLVASLGKQESAV